MLVKGVLFVMMCFSLVGCVEDNISSHYQRTRLTPATMVAPCDRALTVQKYLLEEEKKVIQTMIDNGNILIGEAEWVNIDQDIEEYALKQGAAVRACTVLWGKAEDGIDIEISDVDDAETINKYKYKALFFARHATK